MEDEKEGALTEEEEKHCKEETEAMLAGYRSSGGPLDNEASPSAAGSTTRKRSLLSQSNPRKPARQRLSSSPLGSAAATTQTAAESTEAAVATATDDSDRLENVREEFLNFPKTMENWNQLFESFSLCRWPKNSFFLLDKFPEQKERSIKKTDIMFAILSSMPYLREIAEPMLFDFFKQFRKKTNDSYSYYNRRYQILVAIEQESFSVFRALINVHQNLVQLASLSQAEPSHSYQRNTSAQGSTTKSLDAQDQAGVNFIHEVGLDTTATKRPRTIEKLEEIGGRKLTVLEDLGKYKNAVESFDANYQLLIREATSSQARSPRKLTGIGPSPPQLEKEERQKLLTALEAFLSQRIAAATTATAAATATTLETILSQSNTAATTVADFARCVPAPQSDETREVQPFLRTVLRSLGECLDGVYEDPPAHTLTSGGVSSRNNATRDSPPKSSETRDRRRRYVSRNEKKRIADATIVVHGRYVYILRDDAVEIIAEMKPDLRSSNPNPLALLDEASDQIYCHLARHCGICFNFAGAGLDGKATGVVIMTSCIKIIQLRLEKMGSKDVRLVGYETELLPLMTRNNFDAWIEVVKNVNMSKHLRDLRNKLYGPDGDQENKSPDAMEEAIPSGIVALGNLLLSNRADLFGCNEVHGDEIGNLVGHGSFAAVYEDLKNPDAVIKMARFGDKSELEREKEVLKNLLAGKTSQNASIVRLLSEESTVSVTLGGVKISSPALKLGPRGYPIWSCLKQEKQQRNNQLLIYGKLLKAAVDFIHRHKYAHNDISPNNILVDVKEDTPFLTDFGLASKLGEKSNKGFKGSPLFAHAAIFEKYPSKAWAATEAYDFTGLSFSMAALLAGKRRPWPALQPCDVNSNGKANERDALIAWAKHRKQRSSELLTSAGFDKEWLDSCDDSASISN